MEPSPRERRAQRRAQRDSDAESSQAEGDSEGNGADLQTDDNNDNTDRDENESNSSDQGENGNSGQSGDENGDSDNSGGGNEDNDDDNEPPRNRHRKVDWGRRPTFHVQPNIKVQQDIELNAPYDGGLDLSEFEEDFREIANSNGWNSKISAMKLRKNLAGTAKRIVSVHVRDQGQRNVHIDEIFSVLRKRFRTRESRIDAKAAYEGMQQRRDEPVLDFVARFQKARMEAGCRDGEDAAMKFFRALTANVDNLPFDPTRFVDVDSVANAVNGLELTAKIRLKRKARVEVHDDSDDDVPTATNSRLEKESRDRAKRKKNADKPDDADDDEKKSKLPMKDINAFVQRLGVMVEEKVKSHLDAHTRSVAGNRGDNPRSERPPDLPLAGLGGPSNSDTHLHSTCQLCRQSGHEASECQTLTCKRCNRWGHVANNCTWRPICQICLKVGHVAQECERDVQCNTCGRMGHSDRRCRSLQRNNNGNNFQRGGRPVNRSSQPRNVSFQRDAGPRPDQPCYRCGESGHFARDCTQALPPFKGTGSNATPIPNRSGNGRQGGAPYGGDFGPHDQQHDSVKVERTVDGQQVRSRDDQGQGKD